MFSVHPDARTNFSPRSVVFLSLQDFYNIGVLFFVSVHNSMNESTLLDELPEKTELPSEVKIISYICHVQACGNLVHWRQDSLLMPVQWRH